MKKKYTILKEKVFGQQQGGPNKLLPLITPKLFGLCCSILLLFFSLPSMATHFRYGNITWEPVQGQARTIKFTVNSAWRYSFFRNQVGQTISVGTFYIANSSGQIINATPLRPRITAVFSAEDWLISEWTYTVTLPANGDYTAYFQSCCRVSTLKNNRDGQFRVESTVNVGSGNRPPSGSLPIILNLATGLNTANYQIASYDPDGDNVTFRLATSQEASGTNRYVHPSGLSVTSSGLLQFNTSGLTVGNLYSTAVVLSDGSAKTIIDVMIRIVGQSAPPVFDYTVTPANSTVFKVAPGDSVEFLVKASDADSAAAYGGDVKLLATGAPANSFTPNLPTTPAHVTNTAFKWKPTSSDLGTYVITIFAEDDLGVQTSTSVVISVTYAPVFDATTPQEGSTYCVSDGEKLDYEIKAKDLDPSDTVRINSVAIKNPATSSASGFPVKTSLPTNFAVSPTAPTVYGNPASTNLDWTVDASEWGIYEIEYTAEDGYGDETVLSHYYIVNEAPEFTTVPDTVAYENQTYIYTIIATDADTVYGDAPAYSHTWSKIPSWLTLTDNGDGTATLSGTPTSAQIGFDTVRVELHDKTTHYMHNHCSWKFQDFIIEVKPCSLSISATLTDEFCPNANDGSIDLSLTDATGTVTYNWSNGSTNEDLSNLAPGTYSVEIEDSLGCKAVDTFTIVAGQDITNPVVSTQNVTIYLDSNGNASVSATEVDNGSSDACGIDTIYLDEYDFDCSNVGTTNTVTLTVVDVNGNEDTETATVTVLDTVPPTAICKNATVTLSGGTASVTTSDINNGSNDACGILSLSLDNSTWDCSNIGSNDVTLTVSDNNNNVSTCDATVTVIGSIPTVSITETELPEFCQGGTLVLTATPGSGSSFSYDWSTNETTQVIQVQSSDTFEVEVTNNYGCTITDDIVVDYSRDDLLASNTIIAYELDKYGNVKDGDVKLGDGSLVKTGGVTAIGSKGKIDVAKDAEVSGSTTFAKADEVKVKSGGVVSNKIEEEASLTMPSFAYNPYCNSKNDVTVGSNSTATLTDSIYGKVKVGKNSKVTFTSDVIYVEDLKTSYDDTISFTSSCATIYSCKKVEIKKNNIFNAEGKSVLIYTEEDFKVEKNSDVIASVYSKKHIHTNGDKSGEEINMTGFYIGEKIESKHTVWNWDTNCEGCQSTQNKVTTKPVADLSGLIDATQLILNVYPNPNNGNFGVDIFSPEDGDYQVDVYDAFGRLVFTTGKQELSGPTYVPIELEATAKAQYFVRMSVNGEVHTKAILVRVD
jgi:hypothetical protein